MDNLPEIPTEGGSQNRLNSWIAVTVAILAAFMAVTKVKDDNIVQAMLQAKSDSVDRWNEYQAKSIKQNLVELGRDQTKTMSTVATTGNTAKYDEQIKRYEEDIDRYKKEKGELQKEAQDLEARYDVLGYRDDQFDLSDAALSVALALLAVTALTAKRWLFWASLALSAVGIVMGLAGLIGINLHPDWVIKLLT